MEFFEIYNRELGRSGSTRRLFGHQGIINRLGLDRKLDLEFIPTAVEFSSGGDLVSVGIKRRVVVSNWEAKTTRFYYDSGHPFGVLDTKILLPVISDKRIVTCLNGQVRLGEVLENTRALGTDCGCVYRQHRLGVDHDNPHIIYSCSDDGFLRHFDLRSSCVIKLLCCSPFVKRRLYPDRIGLHAMAIDPRNRNYICFRRVVMNTLVSLT